MRIGAGDCYDALHDREVTDLWPRLMAAEATVGAIAFHHAPDVVTAPADERGPIEPAGRAWC